MDALIQYSIPVKGLHNGMHQFDFQIDRAFFQNFEASPIEDGRIDLVLYFDKRPDLLVLQFVFRGFVKTECDRCLAAIDLPLQGDQTLMVKYSMEEEPEEAEVVYISPETQVLNVAKYIYEFICLAMPLIKVYDCENDENRVCNEEMLRYLNQEPEAEEEAESGNPIWDELKKLNSDN